jgi:transposase-like protein
MSQYVPCGRCQSTDVARMGFTWWGGLLGPRVLNHVKCNRCGSTYNGKTGKSNATAIAIYMIVILVIFFIIGLGIANMR